MSNRKSILLTAPEGSTTTICHEDQNTTTNHLSSKNSPRTETSDNNNNDYFGTTHSHDSSGVKFDSEQIENDRGRTKSRNYRENNANSSIDPGHTSGSFHSSNISKSRSRSRASSRIRDEEFLKWTVLRKDPSMRLKFKRAEGDNAASSGFENYVVADDDSEADDDDDEVSDEEQVSDLENELEIDDFNFDLGMKVLPNFCIPINEVLERSSQWISDYNKEIIEKKIDPTDDMLFNELEGGFIKAMELISKNNSYTDETNQQVDENAKTNPTSTSSSENKTQTETETSEETSEEAGDSYIFYTDLSTESTYALTYIMGALVKNNDTLYIVHWEGSNTSNSTNMKDKMTTNLKKIKENVMYLNDCNNSIIDKLDVITISMTHPYPKHFLNEMIYGLKPKSLICSLNVILSPSGLQNYVCSIPILVIRKKLKRTRRRGINE